MTTQVSDVFQKCQAHRAAPQHCVVGGYVAVAVQVRRKPVRVDLINPMAPPSNVFHDAGRAECTTAWPDPPIALCPVRYVVVPGRSLESWERTGGRGRGSGF
ncbi:hypothetical protein SLS62_003575 [Diatrype stigma]|uniref:Uncharacterized protein n=1 Tax=Diatrype stigma TaxID=117547 RepID=A0AAN9USF8_9PEZI